MSQPVDQFNVDLEVLRCFADGLGDQTRNGLQPGVDRAVYEVGQGVRFGSAVPGGQVAAGREVVDAALSRARENARRQVLAAQILSDVIERVLHNYAEADELSERQLALVEQMLSDAVASAESAYQPAAPATRRAAQRPRRRRRSRRPVTSCIGRSPARSLARWPFRFNHNRLLCR